MTLEELKKIHGHDCDLMYKESVREPYTPDGVDSVRGDAIRNEKLDLVKCAECKFWGKQLGPHVKIHGYKNIKEYKFQHGLTQKFPLVSKEISRNRSLASQGRTPPKSSNPHLAPRPYGNGNRTTTKKNRFNLCPWQIASRIETVALQTDQKPEDVTSGDLYKHDVRLYRYLSNNYGSVREGCEKLGITYGNRCQLKKNKLIAEVRSFVEENGFFPKREDFAVYGLRDRKTYAKHFGSLTRMRIESGVDDLIKEARIRKSQLKALRSL